MWPNPQETADLVTFTEEILNGKLHFLCSVLGTLLFNKNMIDLFYECTDSSAAGYADDTAPYSCETDIYSFAFELLATPVPESLF